MTNLHIEIGTQLPTLETDPDLRTRVQTLVFDNEKFRTGLAETGLPETAVSSLSLKASYDEHLYSSGGVSTSYYRDDHKLAIRLANNQYAYKRELTGAWARNVQEGKGSPLSDIINYDLAWQAQNITDKTIRQNTSVALDRLYTKEIKNLRLLSRLALAGSVVGAEVAHDLTDYHPLLGSSAGMIAAFLITVPIAQLRNKRAANKSEPLAANLRKRADEFAQSQRAYDLFDGVVKIEWLRG